MVRMTSEPIGTPRQRAHAQTVLDIKRLAREQLATEGSSGLSLRAIARQLGIVSSAIYRYVPSRDELLTMLIEDAYNSLGEAAETAQRRVRRADLEKRWLAIGRAVRGWALEHRAEYALLYGSPVPGYAAPPERTAGPGSRVILLIVELLVDTGQHGVRPIEPAPPPIPAALKRDLRELRENVDIDIDDELLVRGFLAWSALYGMVSFELFGQYRGSIQHNAAFFDHQLARLGQLIGFPDQD
jgi:AcrR family transcriptional regulator